MSQFNLKERLGSAPTRADVIKDCVELIEEQVKAKSGLSGAAIRTAYATIKRVKKGFIEEVVDGMLDDWLVKLQPYYDTYTSGGAGQSGASFADFLVARSDDVSEDLLDVTDRRAENTRHKTAKKAYLKMRGSAKRNVTEAIPDLGRLMERRVEMANAPA
ncbi:DUF6918 family protein [Haliangium ochraceum]|uniref:Uncharacterized protein n=1 Tax=Haliangium ochraceum (strain DSM 14365 / JCM 11303 / SMP-2) TaxID=502025 RepID=D0LU65_HALO1|nr:hypothetical protein [Haliangium ochraceum]ACY17429.1 conserved hypothetical protein [Haliangium ochraceum DSM 14365]